MELFKPEPGLMIWTVISFLILLILLWKFAFGPLVDILEKRSNKIQDSLREAEETRNEAERLLGEYKEQLKEARKESQKIIEQGKKLGESIREEIMGKAKQEADQTIVRAREEILREKENAIKELRSKVADLTIEASSKVIQKSLDKQEHLKLIEEFISEVNSFGKE